MPVDSAALPAEVTTEVVRPAGAGGRGRRSVCRGRAVSGVGGDLAAVELWGCRGIVGRENQMAKRSKV